MVFCFIYLSFCDSLKVQRDFVSLASWLISHLHSPLPRLLVSFIWTKSPVWMPSQPSDVRFFCFQNLVNKMWIGIASQDKMEIRSCLPKLLLAQHKTVPYFIRNKLCKVIVDIGRQDWPMFYHDFFTNTLQVRPACGSPHPRKSIFTILTSWLQLDPACASSDIIRGEY